MGIDRPVSNPQFPVPQSVAELSTAHNSTWFSIPIVTKNYSCWLNKKDVRIQANLLWTLPSLH